MLPLPAPRPHGKQRQPRLCGTALAAPPAPGCLFEGGHHASAAAEPPRQVPRPIRAARLLQTAPGPMAPAGRVPRARRGAPWGQSGGGKSQAPLTDAPPMTQVPGVHRPHQGVHCMCPPSMLRGALPTSRGAFPSPRRASPSMDCSQGCLIYILASSMPRLPSPTTLPGWWIRCSTPSAVPSALSPLASSGAAPRLPALIVELLGNYVEYTGVSTRASPAAVCSGQREALCTPCPWVPANPNKRSRHNGLAEAPARPQRKGGKRAPKTALHPSAAP